MKMRTYEATVTRTVQQTIQIKVKAQNIHQARVQAEAQAHNTDFTGRSYANADYEVEHIQEVK